MRFSYAVIACAHVTLLLLLLLLLLPAMQLGEDGDSGDGGGSFAGSSSENDSEDGLARGADRRGLGRARHTHRTVPLIARQITPGGGMKRRDKEIPVVVKIPGFCCSAINTRTTLTLAS